MAYASWSVVFGEQPSAAKWNILGTNDASFNDGTGIADGAVTSAKLAEAFFRGRYQADTTNSAPTGLTVQFGWGWKAGDGTPVQTETVTFPTAFSAAPTVLISCIGTSEGSDPTGIGSFTTLANIAANTNNITASSFIARTKHIDNSNVASSSRIGYSWIAIGTV